MDVKFVWTVFLLFHWRYLCEWEPSNNVETSRVPCVTTFIRLHLLTIKQLQRATLQWSFVRALGTGIMSKPKDCLEIEVSSVPNVNTEINIDALPLVRYLQVLQCIPSANIQGLENFLTILHHVFWSRFEDSPEDWYHHLQVGQEHHSMLMCSTVQFKQNYFKVNRICSWLTLPLSVAVFWFSGNVYLNEMQPPKYHFL